MYFISEKFNDELKFVFSNENIDICSTFSQTFLNILNECVPLKKKPLKANHVSHVSKAIEKP